MYQVSIIIGLPYTGEWYQFNFQLRKTAKQEFNKWKEKAKKEHKLYCISLYKNKKIKKTYNNWF